MKKIYLLGVGHNTPVFIDLAEHCGWEVSGLFHYNGERTGEVVNGFSILGSFDELFRKSDLSGSHFLLTMGDNRIRGEIAQKIRTLGGSTPALIHPTAVVSRFAHIAEGVTISAFSYLQANSKIGKDTIILSGVNISHDNRIGKSCFIAGGATIGAYTHVGDFVFVGQGAMTVSDKVKQIGDCAFIGAGSLVTKSVPPQTSVAGRPAKPLSQ